MSEPGGQGASSEQGPSGGHGTIADEAVRLLDAVSDWVRRNLEGPASSHIATGAPECTWCPICQLIALVRGDRPEIGEKISEAGASVMNAARTLIDAAAAQAAAARPGSGGTQPTPRVQHIDLAGDGD